MAEEAVVGEGEPTGEVIPEVSISEPVDTGGVAVDSGEKTGSLLGSPAAPDEIPTADVAPLEDPSIYGDMQVQWPENFSDEFKNETTLKPYVGLDGKFNVNGAVKSLIHAQKSLGQGRLRVPTEDSPKEDWIQFHREAFGYNPKIEEYGIEFKKEGSNFRDDFPEEFIKYAHENMMPPKMVDGVLDYMNNLISDQYGKSEQIQTESVNKNIEELEKKWGAGFSRKISAANMVLEDLGTDNGFLEYMQDTGLKDDTKLAEFLAAVGEKLYGEDSFMEGKETTNMNGRLTPEESEIEINNIYADKGHPYHNKQHPNNKHAVDEMTKLFEMKRGRG